MPSKAGNMSLHLSNHFWACSTTRELSRKHIGFVELMVNNQSAGWLNSCQLTPYWLNREQSVSAWQGEWGELTRGDRLHGCTWVKEIKICVVCDHFPCQNNHASQPPFTFYPADPTSSSLPALTRTSQAQIIELTTLWDRQPWPPQP